MSQSNENPFLKGPRVQGGNPFLNGPRIQRQSPLATLGSLEYRARAQNLARSRNADELMATSSREPVDRTIGEVINDTALALRQGARNVTAGVVGLPVDAANFAIDPLGARLGRMAAAKIGDALGVSLPERAKTIKGLLTGSDYFEQPAAVRGIREGISETNRADHEEWASDWLRQREQQFEKVDGFGGTLSYLARNPGYTGHVLAEQVPQVALNVVPGSKLGTLLAQGASAGGQASAEVSESLRKKGVSEQEIAAASSGAFAGSAVINTAVGPLMGRYGGMAFERAIGREIAEDAAATVAGRMGVFGRAVGGETATNIIEEGGDQANQNFWSRDPLLGGVGKAAAIGGLMGAGMGATAGATGVIGASTTPAKPSDTLRSELLTLGEELAGRDVVRDAARHTPSISQPVQHDADVAPEDVSDIDALLMRNLPQGLGEQLAAGAVFDAAAPVLDATRIGDALAGVDFAQQAPKLDATLLGEMLAGDVLSRQPESNPETPEVAGSLLTGAAKTEAPQGVQAEVPVKHSEVGQSDAEPVGDRPSLLLRAKEIIRNALRLSKADKRYTESHELMGVSESEVAEARENGLDILGYKHAVDGSAIRHVFKNHGNAKKEAARGQIAITDADFERIPEILESPDKRIYGLKNDIGREMVGYLKTMPDGTTFYLEEVRTGRRTLTAQSMRKYPRTTSAASIEKTLRPTSETLPGDGGSVAQSGAKETLWKRSVRPAPTDVASGSSPEALTEPLPHAVTGSAANIGRTGGDARADSAPPAEPVAEPQKNSTTVMQHRDHPHAVSADLRPAEVDIEDAVKAQSEPKRSNRDEQRPGNENGVPRGLPAEQTADSDRLEQGINRWRDREGHPGHLRIREVRAEALPDALRHALDRFHDATGTRIVLFRNLTPEVDDFNGVTFGDGTAYVNEDNQYPLTLTAAHEWLHNLRRTNSDLYWQLADEVIRQGDLPGYQQRLKREKEPRWHDMDIVAEELTAAAVSDALTDPEFLQRLAERNRGLFRRVARAFLDFLNTLTQGWRDQGSNQYLQDVAAFRDKLAAVLNALPERGDTGSADVDAMYSRKAQTKAAYEARVDALFAGAKGSRQGVRILDRADMLDMLGHGDRPLHLVESAVGKKDSAGRVKHPGMTAEMWKRLPGWIENPVAAFESDTVDGRITLVAPDLVDGKPALVVLEPNGSMAGMDVHVAVNAYEKDNAAGVPTARWVRNGKLLYLDQKRSPTFSERSGLQLPRDVRQLRGYRHRVQTEADLHKYRDERDEAMFSRKSTVPLTPEQEAFMAKAGLAADTRSTWQKARDWAAERVPDMSRMKERAAQWGLDRYYGLKDAVNKTGNIDLENDPYVAARMLNIASTMEAVLRFGAPKLKDGVLQVDRSIPGLLDALAPVKDNLNGFLGWMVARRAQLLKSQGRENLMSDADIAAGLSLRDGNEAAFDQAARDYLRLKNAILDLAEQTGTVNPQMRAMWDHAEYIPFYREGDYGAGTKKGLENQTAGIKQLKGGEAALRDPLANIMQNFTRLIDSGMKNRAMLLAVDQLGDAYFTKLSLKAGKVLVPADEVRQHLLDNGVSQAAINAMPRAALNGMARMLAMTAPTGDNVVRVMRDGKPEYYEVADPLVLRSITAMEELQMHGLIKAMGWFKRVLTAGATMDPSFLARNLMRDTGEAAATARERFIPMYDTLRGAAESLKESELAQDLMMAGSYFRDGVFHQGDFDATQRATRRALQKHGVPESMIDKVVHTLINPKRVWDMYRALTESTEMGSRISLARNRMNAGGSRLEAAFEAKDFLDFGLHGDGVLLQWGIRTLPFLNARLQGNYRLFRMATGKERRKMVAARLASIALFTAALYFWNMTEYEEEWENLNDWDKDMYWHIAPGTRFHIRIPKPFEIGLFAGTAVERSLAALMYQASDGKRGDHPKQTFKAAGRGASDTLALNPVPQAAKPLFEQSVNYNIFMGRNIESAFEQHKVPSERKTPRSSETAILLSKAMAGDDGDGGISPKRIEHLVRGYFGSMGMYVLRTADALVRAATDAPERPAMRLRDMPAIGALYRGDGMDANTRWTGDFYELRDQARKQSDRVKTLLAEGDHEAAARIERKYAWLLGRRERSTRAKAGFMHAGVRELNRQGTKLADMRKREAEIYASRTMNGDEKNAELEQLYRERNKLTRAATQSARMREREQMRQ